MSPDLGDSHPHTLATQVRTKHTHPSFKTCALVYAPAHTHLGYLGKKNDSCWERTILESCRHLFHVKSSKICNFKSVLISGFQKKFQQCNRLSIQFLLKMILGKLFTSHDEANKGDDLGGATFERGFIHEILRPYSRNILPGVGMKVIILILFTFASFTNHSFVMSRSLNHK